MYHLANLLEWKQKWSDERAAFEYTTADDERRASASWMQWQSYLRFGHTRVTAWEDTDRLVVPPPDMDSIAEDRSSPHRRFCHPARQGSTTLSQGARLQRRRLLRACPLPTAPITVKEYDARLDCIVHDEDASEEWLDPWWMRLRHNTNQIWQMWSRLFFRFFPHSDHDVWTWMATSDRWITALNPTTPTAGRNLVRFSHVLRSRLEGNRLLGTWAWISTAPRAAWHFEQWARVVRYRIQPRRRPASMWISVEDMNEMNDNDNNNTNINASEEGGEGHSTAASTVSTASTASTATCPILLAVMRWFTHFECPDRYPSCARLSIHLVRWLHPLYRRVSALTQQAVRGHVQKLVGCAYWSPQLKCELLRAATPMFSRASAFLVPWDDLHRSWEHWFATHDEVELAGTLFLAFWRDMGDFCDVRRAPKEFTALAWRYLPTSAFREWSRLAGCVDVADYVRHTIRNLYLNRHTTEAECVEREWNTTQHAVWWQWYDAACAQSPANACDLAVAAGFQRACIAGELPRNHIFESWPTQTPSSLNWWDWFSMLEKHPGWTPLAWFQHPLCMDDRYHPRTQSYVARWIFEWIFAQHSVDGLRWFATHPWMRHCVNATILGQWRTAGHRFLLRTVERALQIQTCLVAPSACCAALADVFSADNEHLYLRNTAMLLQKLTWNGCDDEMVTPATPNQLRRNVLPGVGRTVGHNPAYLLRRLVQLHWHHDVNRVPWRWIEVLVDDVCVDLLERLLRANRKHVHFIGTHHYVLEHGYADGQWRVCRLLKRLYGLRDTVRCHFVDRAICHHPMLIG